ncbi:hypothetical protein M758_3G147500 [Ceratodon purpureus]|nr:hypothetical protein M758_3G147500 [Ceratodon purpureus]
MATSVACHGHVGRIQGALDGNVASSKLLCQPGRVSVKPSRCTRIVGIRAASQNANGSSKQSVGENFGGKLRLFIDTADAESWQRWLPSGAFYGVTTNPILLEKANVSCQVETLSDLADRAFNLGAEEVQIQTWGQTVEEMVSTGSKLAEIRSGSIVVKIPVTKTGLQAASQLTKSGIRVTMTGVYSVHQALLAVGVGAAYAAPYLGRMVALGKPGLKDIQKMQEIVTGVQSDMRLLVASIKDVKQITKLAASGVNSFAIPVPIIEKLFQDDDTEKAAADFEDAVSRTLKISAATYR